MLKTTIIVGTRPEAIKLIPVFLALQKDPFFQVNLISTGQHREMLADIFRFFETTPSVDLELMTENQGLADFTGKAFSALSRALAKYPSDLIIVQGDTTTAMVAAMVAFYSKIKIAHVEAGLRTHEKFSPFPEEINRRIISLVADFHFAPTRKAADNLKNEGIDNVFVTGNTVVDSLQIAREKIKSSYHVYRKKYENILDLERKNVLITGHRRESFGVSFKKICNSIANLSNEFRDYHFIYPVHLNPNIRKPVWEILGQIPNIHLIDPVAYNDMVFLMSETTLILTDSGGIQEEAPSFNVPVVVMRNHTERMEGVVAGCSVLAGVSDKIIFHASDILKNRDLYSRMSQAPNPYGDGDAAEKIRSVLRQQF